VLNLETVSMSDFAFRQGASSSSSAVYTPVNEQRRRACNV